MNLSNVAQAITTSIIDFTNFCTRFNATIWPTIKLMTKAFKPSPYCKGPCLSKGNKPFVVASQLEQRLTSTSTWSITFSNTMPILVRRSWSRQGTLLKSYRLRGQERVKWWRFLWREHFWLESCFLAYLCRYFQHGLMQIHLCLGRGLAWILTVLVSATFQKNG